MMSKVYIFLIFMVLILPSLGLTRYPPRPPALNSCPVTSGELCLSPGEGKWSGGACQSLATSTLGPPTWGALGLAH